MMSSSPSAVTSTKLVIALDVGGTSIKSALVARGGKLAGEPLLTPVDSSQPAENILATLAGVVEGYLSHIHERQLLGIALGFPGPFNYAEGISLMEEVAKYSALYGVNIREALRKRLPLGETPIVFRNDAEAAIMGEARYGAGRPFRRLVGITLGTGLGSAFIVDGWRVTSGTGVPPDGWLYRMPVAPAGREGLRADDVFSRRGLEARFWAVGIIPEDVKEAAEAGRLGNPRIRQIFTEFGRDLGEFLDPFVIKFDAMAVLVLGQIAGAFDLFGPALRGTLSRPALPGERGADAALLGAADLLFNPAAPPGAQEIT